MFKSGKIVTVLLLILVLFSLSSLMITYFYLSNEKTKRIALEKQLEEIQQVKKQLEEQLEISKSKVNDLNNQLVESKVKIGDLTSQVDTQKAAREQIISERDNLINELNSKSASLQELTDKLSKAEEEIKTLNEQIDKLRSEEVLEEEAKEEKQSEEIELGKIVVAPTEIPAGEILTVNEEHNFVVINLGNNNGVNLGQVFSVYHKQKFVGKIQIVKVQDDLSVANLLPDTKINSIRKGDRLVAE